MSVEVDEIVLENGHTAVADDQNRMKSTKSIVLQDVEAAVHVHRKNNNVHADESVHCTGMFRHQVCKPFFFPHLFETKMPFNDCFSSLEI